MTFQAESRPGARFAFVGVDVNVNFLRRRAGLLRVAILLCSLLPFCGRGSAAVTVQTTHPGVGVVVAIGSLNIDGTLYDVSFNNSFGEMMFLGEPYARAHAAGEAIREVLNFYFIPFYTQTGGDAISSHVNMGSGTLFRITSNIRGYDEPESPGLHEFYQAEIAAGWIASTYPDGFMTSNGPPALYGEATFRLAVPDSIPHTIPELKLALLIPLGISMLFVRRRFVG